MNAALPLARLTLILGYLLVLNTSAKADGPTDNQVASVRPIPPLGIAIDAKDREELEAMLDDLGTNLQKLQSDRREVVQRYLPDVEVFHKAVKLALEEDGFFEPKDVAAAKRVLSEGLSRATKLSEGSHAWTQLNCSACVVRGFRSKIDGSVQPYGIVWNGSPKDANGCTPIDGTFYRGDVWCRGRSEKGLELQFIATRMNNREPNPEPGVIMVHPFGRYCNANKLAGEVDTLEALEHAIQEYPIDPHRVAIRGFSMGGAAAWHLAVHYPDRWFAANPGAGFSETPLFLNAFQSEELKPYWFEQSLWQLYDCPGWVRNLRMLPTVAYSGEIDRQKQAADVMAAASWNLPEDERFELTHIIAPNVAHKFDPIARIEVEERLGAIERRMPQASFLPKVSFTTMTLKYHRAHWITLNGLGEHWKPATIKACLSDGRDHIKVAASNVSDFSIDIPADQVPTSLTSIYLRTSDNCDGFDAWDPTSEAPAACLQVQLSPRSDGSWGARFRRNGSSWERVSPIETNEDALAKKHDLQGPIDDAFMAPFLFVKPSQSGRYPEVDRWVDAEFQRAIREWHRQMRGDVLVKSSDELKPDDYANYHLILWGDPQSNPTLGKIADQLPIQWSADQIVVGDRKFDARQHAPVMIYPNPLNPRRYVVVNSSFTYREYDYLNNARQVPKLPDWAVIDLSTPPDARWPGKIADADFFGERWELKPTRATLP